jgi:hydrogenase expression/formation protein HypD
VENAYPRVVSLEGNRPAQDRIAEVFELTDRNWRGMGRIPKSGWQLREEYRGFDAEWKFELPDLPVVADTVCRSGEILRGTLKPNRCPAFGNSCTPRTPLGATMVSSEGACAAYFNYGRLIDLNLRSVPEVETASCPA